MAMDGKEFKVDRVRPVSIVEFDCGVKITKMTSLQLTILKNMALRGEMDAYRMRKELNFPRDSPKVLKSFKRMERLGYIKKLRIERSEKDRKDPKIIYGLTQLGLSLAIITRDKDIETGIGDIIGKWSHLLPTLSAKWEYMARYVTEEKAFEELRSAMWRFVHLPKYRAGDRDLESEFIDGLFYKDTGVGTKEPWLTMILNDRDLRARAESTIRNRIDIIEDKSGERIGRVNILNHHRELCEILDKLRGKNETHESTI